MSVINMHIPNVLDQLHNAGYQLSYLEGHLYDFDSFLDGMYPGIEKIDKTICEKWIYMEDKYTPHSLQQRVSTIKYLGKYLGSIGIKSYIPDYGIDLGPHRQPSLFDDNQLIRFFCAADHLPAHGRSPNREYIAPVLFRLIYACGLRNSEACSIRMKDISLENGKINIYHSKGDKDRVVYMDDSVLQMCRLFNDLYSSIVKDREYFFQISDTRTLTKYNVDDFFDLILNKSGLDKEFSNKPTVHDLRHLFAVNNMRKCIENNENFENRIKYLSLYMGHKSVKETMYYLHMVVSLLPQYRKKMKSLTQGMETIYEEG